ncbi:short chain dehydrogenase [Mycobacterium malmoense]|nr:SDR family oxidoreductase [Mycobacterium malmoense]OCB40242.1 short chain dehydrogenase [Mycobacterium malmoense]
MPTALITGAGGGIGSAIATALAPTHTVLLAGRPSDRLDAVAERLGSTTFPLDLTVRRRGHHIGDRGGDGFRFEELGGVIRAALERDEWRTTFAVNVFGPVELTLALLPALRRAHGQVVFINSGSGRNVSPGTASYSASKFALRAFADSLRADEPDLRVTTVYPGRTDSQMQRELVAFEGGTYDPAKFLKPETVATAVANVVATPPDGHVHEVVLRPTGR